MNIYDRLINTIMNIYDRCLVGADNYYNYNYIYNDVTTRPAGPPIGKVGIIHAIFNHRSFQPAALRGFPGVATHVPGALPPALPNYLPMRRSRATGVHNNHGR